MLNIPETVKALYKQDGVNKNFRAHFPNGELPDITNDNIVQESVKFQESVCSQDVFKFGLTEASVIEFETVGVANMYGMTIACYNEIDCSSLTAVEKADIAAGTWDGTWDAVNEVFAVPYGVFRVESCPRDHQAMAHRQVTAYSFAGGEIRNDAEERKLAMFVPTSQYKPDIWLLLMACANQGRKDGLLEYGFTRTQEAPSTTVSDTRTVTLKDAGGADLQFTVNATDNRSNNLTAGGTSQRLISSEPGEDYYAVVDAAGEALEAEGVDYAKSGYKSMRELVTALLASTEHHNFLFPGVDYVYTREVGSSLQVISAGGVDLPTANYAFYAGHTNLFSGGSVVTHAAYPNRFVITTADTPPRTVYDHHYTAATVYSYLPPAGAPSLVLSFWYTANSRVNGMACCSFTESYKLNEILNGLLELNCQFAIPGRDGAYKIMRLSNASPVAVIPGEYSQMWFDEYDVDPVGVVRYTYTDAAGEEQVVDYQFGDGMSIYDMTDNAVIRTMDNPDPATINAMLEATFIPYLQTLAFVPIDLNMKGLPYIEAGDALAVTAQDGTVCNSYALRREMNGVQVLTDQINSESGLIIDSEEGT